MMSILEDIYFIIYRIYYQYTSDFKLPTFKFQNEWVNVKVNQSNKYRVLALDIGYCIVHEFNSFAL